MRTTHRRRKVFARGGVLASFGLAMVVYPIMGNVVEYHNNAAEGIPGVVLGESPTTGHALLGDGPALIPTVLEVPAVDGATKVATVAETAYLSSALLPNCVLPANYDGEVNGQLPAEHLCLLPDGSNYLRADVAQAYAQMNAQFKATFGRDLCILEGYRSYADQVRIKSLRGYLAASPGTSMHGLGLAFDLCNGDYTGASKVWLDSTAAAYGFVNPDWAKYRKYEPWHWEYKPGTDAINLYGSSDYSDGGTSDATTTTVEEPATVTTPVDPAPAAVVTPEPTVAAVTP